MFRATTIYKYSVLFLIYTKLVYIKINSKFVIISIYHILKEITYITAEEIVRDYLKSLNNLSEYSRNRKINYQVLSSIKNGNPNKKVYTNIVLKILEELKYKPIKVIKSVSYIIQEA